MFLSHPIDKYKLLFFSLEMSGVYPIFLAHCGENVAINKKASADRLIYKRLVFHSFLTHREIQENDFFRESKLISN